MRIAPRRVLASAAVAAMLAVVAVPAASVALGSAGSDIAIRATPDVASGFLARPQRASSWWGGVHTLATGETVRLYFSDAYPVDNALASRWVSFLEGLVHGPELSRLTIYFGPLDVVASMCGEGANACYATDEQAIVTIGDDTGAKPSVEQLLAHEYGHHVANNRSNAPWRAIDWGTKRWATYERVCSRARAGDAFPGDEGSHYTLNPGEAFAEAYRALTDARQGFPFMWPLIDPTFTPDATALALVRRDVLEPWAPSTKAIRGSFTARGRSITVRIATPRDGSLSLRLSTGAGLRVGLSATPTLRLGKDGTHATTICGQRHVVVRLTSRSGAGRYLLRVVKP